jgi:recombination protein RecT
MAYKNNEMTKQKTDPAVLAKQTATQVNGLLLKNKGAIMKTLPAGFNFDRMCRTLINAISTTPQLAQCSPASLFLSSVRSFSLGLEPNGALNEAYLVPFWNSKKACNEAQFMPSYRGLQMLARRSGEIAEIYAKTVKENDLFEVEEGTERKITHKPNYTKDRGAAVCFYAVFKTKDGNIDFEIMTIDEVDAIRNRSKAANAGPWVTDYEEMAKKTVMRRLLKRAPMSIELAKAVSADNTAAVGEFGKDDIIEIEGFSVDDAETSDIQAKMNADRTAELREKVAAKSAAVPAAVDNDFAPMIAAAIKRTQAPTSVDAVLNYANSKGLILSMDDDFETLVNEVATAELV